MGWLFVFANPEFVNMKSYSANVYASPACVFTSMVRLKAAGVGGETRSSFGTNSKVTAFPPGFTAAWTRRISRLLIGVKSIKDFVGRGPVNSRRSSHERVAPFRIVGVALVYMQ